MYTQALSTISIVSILGVNSLLPISEPVKNQLAQKQFSLENRQEGKYVNDVQKDNILLTTAYLSGKVSSKDQINWDEIRKPFHYSMTLNPGEAFAYHEAVMEKYQGKIIKTTNSHFNFEQGFKHDGILMGDGVCHFASLIEWVASDAGLQVEFPTNHDFAVINEVPKEHGVSIYFDPNNPGNSQRQNLYIVNNKQKAVEFVYEYDGVNLKVSVNELN